MARRVEFIDYGKAVAIIAVVLHHVGCSAMKHIGLFAMPLFFLTSGYFTSGGEGRSRNTRSTFSATS